MGRRIKIFGRRFLRGIIGAAKIVAQLKSSTLITSGHEAALGMTALKT